MRLSISDKDKIAHVIAVKTDGLCDVFSRESGRTSSKTVSFSDLAKCFGEAHAANGETFVVPENCFKMYRKGSRRVFSLFFKKHVLPSITYTSSGTSYVVENVIVPNSVMTVVLDINQEGQIKLNKTYLNAVDNNVRKVDKDTLLYAWPFSNYSPTYSSGVCWGRDGEGIINGIINEDLTSLSFMFNFYFSKPFNSDLIGQMRQSEYHLLSQPSLTAGNFPMEFLRSTAKFSTFFNGICGG